MYHSTVTLTVLLHKTACSHNQGRDALSEASITSSCWHKQFGKSVRTWAARYNTWLLIALTPKGMVFSFSFVLWVSNSHLFLGCHLASANGPYRLIGHNNFGPVLHLACDRLHLLGDDFKGLIRFPLLQSLAHTQDHAQALAQCILGLLCHSLQRAWAAWLEFHRSLYHKLSVAMLQDRFSQSVWSWTTQQSPFDVDAMDALHYCAKHIVLESLGSPV